MEKKLIRQLTFWVVAVTLVVALGTALWRASDRGGAEVHPNHNHHSLEFFNKRSASS
jgi:hypothetical protein